MQTAFRDGLAIALLALVPLRRRTLSALRIGKHLVKTDDRWSLEIPAADVKSRRPLDYSISGELSERIDVYINEIRSQTAGADAHDHLWASSRGRPMNGQVLYKALRRHLRMALGFPISLHHFRRAAATFWSMRDPVNVRAVRDLLGHTTFATTERYYVMAQSRLAGRAFARAVAAIRAK
jgi:integrase/recombinase XerD